MIAFPPETFYNEVNREINMAQYKVIEVSEK